MSQAIQEYTDLLLRNGIISLDQLSEAEQVAKDTSTDVGDVLVQMEYATPEEVAKALADFHKIPFIDLRQARISDDVIELVMDLIIMRSCSRHTRSLKVGINRVLALGKISFAPNG